MITRSMLAGLAGIAERFVSAIHLRQNFVSRTLKAAYRNWKIRSQHAAARTAILSVATA
jgi:hypothetical protein